MKLIATRYQTPYDRIFIEARDVVDDEVKAWAVIDCGHVLNIHGEWEYEPSPSSRDDEFLARARFPTLAQASDALAVDQAADDERRRMQKNFAEPVS